MKARPSTQKYGSAIRPRKATIAPRSPNQRRPSTTETLPTLGPGRNWHSDRISVNSAGASQRFSSTMTRWAHGSTPPKDLAPIERKPQYNSHSDFGGVVSNYSP